MSSSSTRVLVYSYTPLPSHRAIRLLELHTATSFSLTIIHDLGDSPHYDALSYTWGNSASQYSQTYVDSPELNIPSIPVNCDCGTILLTPNLRDALRMLSESSTSNASSHQRFIWIDAICINQANLDERAAQVELMGDLYRKAQTVYVWLGQEDEFTSDAFAAMECLHSIPKDLYDIVVSQDFYDSQTFTSKLGLSPPSPSHLLGLVAFLQRPYFKRIWVVQEVGLADRAIVKCGLRTVPWQTLSDALQFLAASGWATHLHTAELRRIDFGKQEPSYYQRLLSVNIDPGYSAYALIYNKSRLATTGRLIPFKQLLNDHRPCQASDPRDKIYALLGISDRDLRLFGTYAEAFRPNYTIDIQTLFTRVTRALLQSYEDLELLFHVESRPKYSRIAELPSWVPDYTVAVMPGSLETRGPENSWCAAAGLKWRSNSQISDDRKLQVQGMCSGAICDFSDSMHDHPDPSKYWATMAQVALGVSDYYPADGGRGPQTRFEALWRTLLADMFMDEGPAPASCGQQFLGHISALIIQAAGRYRQSLHAQASGDFSSDQGPRGSGGIFQRLTAIPGRLVALKRLRNAPWVNHPHIRPWDLLIKSEPPGSSVEAEFERAIAATLENGETAMTQVDLERPFAQLRLEMSLTIGLRRLFRTNGNLLGVGPDNMQFSDEVWVLAGSRTPFALRQVNTQGNEYQLLGEVYLHGMMHGEATDLTTDLTDIQLV